MVHTQQPMGGPVDAHLFLQFSDSLKDAHRRLVSARVPEASRARLRRRLIAITDAAQGDLVRAGHQFERFSVDLERELRRG